jgi:hypothetical protein
MVTNYCTPYHAWCSNLENWLKTSLPSLELPEGSITGVFNSAAISFVANMFFNRCNLSTSLKGGGVAILAKSIQLTIAIAQHHLKKSPEEATPNPVTLEPEQTRFKYSLIYIQDYCSKSAAFVSFYLKKIPLPASALPQIHCSPVFSPGDCYMAAALILFSLRKITSPSIDPWTTMLSTWVFSRICDLSNMVTLPFCIALKI